MALSDKILIVDDDPTMNTAMEIAVEGEFGDKYEILTACDGRTALSICENQKPKVMVLDLMLSSQLNGFGVLERLKRSQREMPNTIIVTGNHGKRCQEYAESVFGIPLENYIRKPFRMETLTERIKPYLQEQPD